MASKYVLRTLHLELSPYQPETENPKSSLNHPEASHLHPRPEIDKRSELQSEG